MRKFAVALLATTVMASPAAFAASSNYQQRSQGQQTQGQQTQQSDSQKSGMKQGGQNAQNQNANDRQDQNQKQQSAQDQQSKQQQSAENKQPVSPQDLSRNEIRQVQQALLKDGFHSGRADGRWGPETQSAVKQFQQSKQMKPTGKLDQQTVADLGLDASQFSQSQNQQQ